MSLRWVKPEHESWGIGEKYTDIRGHEERMSGLSVLELLGATLLGVRIPFLDRLLVQI